MLVDCTCTAADHCMVNISLVKLPGTLRMLLPWVLSSTWSLSLQVVTAHCSAEHGHCSCACSLCICAWPLHGCCAAPEVSGYLLVAWQQTHLGSASCRHHRCRARGSGWLPSAGECQHSPVAFLFPLVLAPLVQHAHAVTLTVEPESRGRQGHDASMLANITRASHVGLLLCYNNPVVMCGCFSHFSTADTHSSRQQQGFLATSWSDNMHGKQHLCGWCKILFFKQDNIISYGYSIPCKQKLRF